MSWLRGQLTKAKQDSPLWGGLADAVQEIFDVHVTPVVDRLWGLNSYFTMNDEDLQQKIDELGFFFLFSDNVAKDDKPLALLQRLDEIHFKRTDLPIKNAISREFSGLSVEWSPLYAPKVITPNGSADYTKKLRVEDGEMVSSLRTLQEVQDVGESEDDYFLTSRGVIEVGITDLARTGLTPDDLVGMVTRIITPLIPTDIVYDGEKILIHYHIIEAVERLYYDTDQFVLHDFAAVKDAIEKASMIDGASDEIAANNDIDVPASYKTRLDVMRLDCWVLDLD